MENVFSLTRKYSVIIQHDGGKLSVLHFYPSRFGSDSFSGGLYASVLEYRLERVDPIPFFDDKMITNVVAFSDSSVLTCFVTNEGYVYWARWESVRSPYRGDVNWLRLRNQDDDIATAIVRDTFFDANPLATEGNALRIRSAGNALTDPC